MSGLNTYAYVEAAPLTDSDPYGLITGTEKGFWRGDCRGKDRTECEDKCRMQGKTMKECKVTRGVRTVVRNGVAVPELYTVPGSWNCVCSDCEEESVIKRIWDWLTKPRYKDDMSIDPNNPYPSDRHKPGGTISPAPPRLLPI